MVGLNAFVVRTTTAATTTTASTIILLILLGRRIIIAPMMMMMMMMRDYLRLTLRISSPSKLRLKILSLEIKRLHLEWKIFVLNCKTCTSVSPLPYVSMVDTRHKMGGRA